MEEGIFLPHCDAEGLHKGKRQEDKQSGLAGGLGRRAEASEVSHPGFGAALNKTILHEGPTSAVALVGQWSQNSLLSCACSTCRSGSCAGPLVWLHGFLSCS